MNLLARLLRRRKPTQVDDAILGCLEFDRGVWTRTPKDKDDFMLVIVAPESGPLDVQRRFIQDLSRTLEETVQVARRFVQESDSRINGRSLVLYAIEIGPPEEIARGMFVVELSDPDQDRIHRAEFVRAIPTVYGCDD